MQHDSSDELHIEMDHIPDNRLITDQNCPFPQPARRIFDSSKRFGKDRVQAATQLIRVLDVRKVPFPISSFLSELIVRKRLEFLLQTVNLFNQRPQPPDLPLVFRTQYLP